MARTTFSFLEGYPVVDVTFPYADGVGRTSRRLVVDTGFTGRSALILDPRDHLTLRHKPHRTALVRGALAGSQDRISLVCSMPSLSYESILIAIVADLAPLSLPSEADGLAGLTFLDQFQAWGAEHDADGAWQFYLET